MRKSPQVAEGPAGQPRSPPRPGGGFKDSAPGVLHLGSPAAPRSQLSAGTEGRTRARARDGAARVLPLRLLPALFTPQVPVLNEGAAPTSAPPKRTGTEDS